MDRITVLDHGYVELVEPWGSDEAIICAARMSTQKGFEGWGPNYRCSSPKCGEQVHEDAREYGLNTCPACGSAFEPNPKPGDEKLLRYLWENKHSTPFEMAGMTVRSSA